jgi:hypothetical protein
MGINTPDRERYGALTEWTREIPVLSTIGWATHKVRNGIFKLPLLDKVEGVADRII